MISIPDFMVVMRMFSGREEEALSLQELYHNTGITYAHITKLVKMMNEFGWIDIEKTSRENYLIVTKQGKDIANNIDKLFVSMKINYADLVKKKRKYICDNDLILLTDKLKVSKIDEKLDSLNKQMEQDLNDYR